MEAKREFLRFEQPAVQSASRLLVDRYRTGKLVDLSSVVVVVPGGRVGRRLRAHLLRRCEEQNAGLLAPRVVTGSHLPELLYRPQRPFASIPLQQMMWGRGLKLLDVRSLRHILPGAPSPKSRDAAHRWSESDWLEYGTVLWRQYRALAAEGLSFADVCEMAATLPDFPESSRWQAMAVLQDQYLQQLDAESLWDQQTARLVAVRNEECQIDSDVFLLGTSDLGRTVRQMLAQVSDRVTALVHAPESWADTFDSLGCLKVDAWCERSIDIHAAQWSVAERPVDQARILATQVGALEDGVRFDEVRIGCADERLVPFVRRVFAELEVPCRWGPGRVIEESGPYQLIKSLQEWLVDDRFANLSTLARHPQIGSWLTEQGIKDDWLDRLDRFHEATLPSSLDELSERAPTYRGTEPALVALAALRGRLLGPAQPAAQWAKVLSDILAELYGAMPKLSNDVDNRFEFAVCERLQSAIDLIVAIPDHCSPQMTSSEVMQLVLSQVDGDNVPAAQEPNAVELLGWLELPLDDAPHLFVGGLNEGIVPQAITSDLFMPNRVREHLQIDDDRRRYARDAYALAVLCESRKTIHLVTSKCDAEGNPLKPSRLLFATNPEEVARRWERILDSSAANSAASLFDVEDRPFGFTVPPIEPQPPIERIRVTDFKEFLKCSYRYYLSKRLNLKAVEHDFDELNAAEFGTLVHEVLGRFGNSDGKDSNHPQEIEQRLNRLLDDESQKRLGSKPLAAVQIQLSQIKQRFKFFAVEQARLIDEGWRIFYSESSNKPQEDETVDVVWEFDGHEVAIIGRIDRIDYHEDQGVYRVLDYKTFDKSEKKKPEDTHWKSGEWLDLQLPLYRHLAKKFGVSGQPQLGYFILGKNATETGVYCANWDEATLETADEKAREVIGRILKNDFDEPVNLKLSYDSWKYLCLEDIPQR
jgi:hypothetical protein